MGISQLCLNKFDHQFVCFKIFGNSPLNVLLAKLQNKTYLFEQNQVVNMLGLGEPSN